MKNQSKIARRTFLSRTLAASAAIPLAGIPIILKADNHHVDENSPSATALGYRHDATTVDIKKHPSRGTPEGKNHVCDNCKLYQAGDDGWGNCGIFPGKQVNGKGWCAAWITT